MDAIYKNEFEHHSVKAIIVALNRWFGSEGKLPVKYFDTFIGYSDFCIDEPYVDSGVHLDGRANHHYNGSTWDSNADCPNRPKNAAYAAIEYLREEHGIFYSPQMEPDNDHKTQGELKARTDADYWFGAARKRLTEIEKLRKEIREQTKHNTDYILTAFRDILDALGIDKSECVAMDIPSLKRYTISEAEKVGNTLDSYRDGAMKSAADISALCKEKERLEKDLKHITDWNADLEKTVMASKENLADILEALGVSKSFSIGQSMEFLKRHAVQRASLIKSERDKYLKKIDETKEINYARNEHLYELTTKIATMYIKIFNPEPGKTCACTAERQLDAFESYISELRTHNEALRKDVSNWISKHNDLRIRCNSVFGKDGFITKSKINDLCDEYSIVRPSDDEDCEASLRYILDILKEYRDRCTKHEDEVARVLKDMTKVANDKDEKVQEMSRAAAYVDTCIIDLYKRVFNSTPQNMFTDEMLRRIGDAYENSLDRGRGAGQTFKLICDICDKYEIKKPSSDLTLEECIDDILKRFKMTLKENQDFCYEVKRLYVNMTDLQPSYRMTILDILRAIAEDVDDREEAYNDMEAKWDTAEKLRKDWVRRYESEHERANGEHKKADKYWAQVEGLQTRIKNLEDALNRAASNATGYEALKNTLRYSLCKEELLKKELDTCKRQLKEANDAIRKQNEAILRKERLDEASDCDTED